MVLTPIGQRSLTHIVKCVESESESIKQITTVHKQGQDLMGKLTGSKLFPIR